MARGREARVIYALAALPAALAAFLWHRLGVVQRERQNDKVRHDRTSDRLVDEMNAKRAAERERDAAVALASRLWVETVGEVVMSPFCQVLGDEPRPVPTWTVSTARSVGKAP